MTETQKDLLGKDLTEVEREILRIYHQLKDLSARSDLPPTVLMNSREAMVMMWNACVSQDLVFEEPGVD